MKIELLQSEFVDRYDRFLQDHQQALLYYSYRFKDFLCDLLDCHSEYWVASRKGRICGVLPLMFREHSSQRVYNSLPFFGSHGGVIAADEEARTALTQTYNKIACAPSTIAATLVSNPLVPTPSSEVRFNYTDRRVSQRTYLPGDGDLCPRIASSARRNANKAVREGITVDIDAGQIDCLRRMHQENLRSLGGTPKSDHFFAKIAAHFVAGRDFDLYVAKRDGRVVAGLLLFYFNGVVEYFVPATHSEYRSLQPMALILQTAMADASRRGCSIWNWGGTWTSQSGVYRFKKKWGAEESEYSYYTQLNDRSLLGWSRGEVLDRFPNFFVVPFAAMNQVDPVQEDGRPEATEHEPLATCVDVAS